MMSAFVPKDAERTQLDFSGGPEHRARYWHENRRLAWEGLQGLSSQAESKNTITQ